MYFSKNEDLYNYLLSLISILKERDRDDLGKQIEFATKQASSSSAEFLGESRIAMKEVLLKTDSSLNQKEKSDLIGALTQIGNVLDKRQGT
jgi:hypothetical protein